MRVYIQNKNFNFLLLFLIFPSIFFAQKKLKLPDDLNEVSGLYIAASDSLYWLNDGGNTNELFLTNNEGAIVKRITVPNTRNIDWEDLTADEKGNIYIGDFGNNRNKRKDLKIYIYSPEKSMNEGVSLVDSIEFNFADQTEFPPARSDMKYDLEAFFYWRGKLHLFSKNKIGTDQYLTQHYILNVQPGKQVAQVKNSLVLPKRVVTAAAISEDGKTMVLLAYYYNKIWGFIPWSRASIFTFTNYEKDDFLEGEMRKRNVPVFVLATQFESIDFISNKHVLVASERTKFIRPKAKRVKVKR